MPRIGLLRPLATLVAASVLALAAMASAAGAQDLFAPPGLSTPPSLFMPKSLGLTPPVRIQPMSPSPGMPGFTGNQCQLAAGTCPLGRLRRTGTLCYCDSGSGTVRQGTTRVKPQTQRP